MGKKQEKILDRLHLPREVFLNIPLLEMEGLGRLRLENYKSYQYLSASPDRTRRFLLSGIQHFHPICQQSRDFYRGNNSFHMH